MDTTVYLDLAKRKKWEELEEIWLKHLENPDTDPHFYIKLIEGMQKREEEARCDRMLALQVTSMLEQGAVTEALKLTRVCLKKFHTADAMRDAALATLEKRYGARPSYNIILKACTLRDSPSPGKAFDKFLSLIQFDLGEAYRHKSWGIGTVTAINLPEKKVTLRFPEKPEAEFTLAGAREYLRRLPRNHFLARLSREPEKMRQMAQQKPAELARLAIQSMGPALKIQDLKKEMALYLMSDGDWRSWWTQARDHIKVDPYIAFKGAGLNAVISLRDKPITISTETLDNLRSAATARKRLEAVRSLVRASQRATIAPEELAPIEQWVVEQCQTTSWDAMKIEMLFLLDQLARIKTDHLVERPTVTIADLVNKPDANLVDVLIELTLYEYQTPVMDLIRSLRSDWPEQYERIIPKVSARLAARGIQTLQKDEQYEALRTVAESILTAPTRDISTYLWGLSEFVHGQWQRFAPALSVDMLIERLLEHLEALSSRYNPSDEDGPQVRSDLNAIRDFLEANHHANARRAVALMTTEGAQRFYDRVQTHSGLDSAERAHIAGALRSQKPELEVKVEENLLTSIYHYVTQESRDRQARALQKLRTVDIPDNSKRIGLAAAMGDLSENAEYDAAKEEQARLMSRAGEMEDMLKYARILDPESIKTHRVGPGTRVAVRYTNGDTITYTFLGVWDADPAHHILSYRSPLGAQFLNKTVGDTVSFDQPSGEPLLCVIESIENALLSAPASGETAGQDAVAGEGASANQGES